LRRQGGSELGFARLIDHGMAPSRRRAAKRQAYIVASGGQTVLALLNSIE
jgi:hypothetical protein